MLEKTIAALIVIDLQPDFMPGGALPVAEGDTLVEPISGLMESPAFAVRVATQDWHPPGHISFASSHPGRRPFESIELYGRSQTLWPDHCVQESAGAQIHPQFSAARLDAIVRKGTDRLVDSYSGFRNNWDREGRRPLTGLAGYLRERGVSKVVLCGLARDYCVKWSALDAAQLGFSVVVLWDLTRPVDSASDRAVREELAGAGVQVMASDEFLQGAQS